MYASRYNQVTNIFDKYSDGYNHTYAKENVGNFLIISLVLYAPTNMIFQRFHVPKCEVAFRTGIGGNPGRYQIVFSSL